MTDGACLYTFQSPDALKGLSLEKRDGEAATAVYGGIQTEVAEIALRVPEGLYEAVELIRGRFVADAVRTESADSVSVYSLAIDGCVVMLYYNESADRIENITYMKDARKTEYLITEIKDVVT